MAHLPTIKFEINLKNAGDLSSIQNLTRSTWFPDLLLDNRELKHGGQFTVTGKIALYLKNTYTTGSNPLLSIVRTETKIALLANNNYVDYSVGDNSSEASNVQATLTNFSTPYSFLYTVNTFTDVSADGFTKVLVDKDILVIPELEQGNLDPALTSDAKTVIYNFVNDGGTLMMFYPDNSSEEEDSEDSLVVLNDIFGFNMDSGDSNEPFSLYTDANGTVFEGAATTIDSNNSTHSVDLPTIPVGSKVIYNEDSAGDAIVLLIPFGDGNIIMYGWDWYNAYPVGAHDGGWIDLLYRGTLL